MLRLQLILGRRLDVVHVAPVAGRDLVGRDLLRVRRPDDRVGIVVAALRSVDAEEREGRLSRLTDRDVVVVDERFELAVWRFLRVDAVDVELRAHRTSKSAAAAPAATAPPAASARRVGPAAVVLERAAPDDGVDRDLDGTFGIDEGERREGQRHAGIGLLRGERGGERRGELLVIERRTFLLGGGLDEYELVATLHRFSIPEARRFLYPGRRFGRVRRQSLVLVAQSHRALVVGDRALRHRRGRRNERREHETSDRDTPGTPHGTLPL